MSNKTWSIVSLPPGNFPIECKWVLRVNKNFNGYVNKYKIMLVAKGFHQSYGDDYTETFSLVTKPVTMKTILTPKWSKGWKLHQLDVNKAFLNGVLEK